MRVRCTMAMVACLLGTATVAFGQTSPGTQPSLLALPTSTAPSQPAGTSQLMQAYAPTAAQPTLSGARYAAPAAQTAYTAWEGDAAPAPPAATSAGHNSGTKSAFDEALSGPCCDDCYAGCESCCTPCCGPLWGAYVGGLIMTRDNPNAVWLTFDNTMIASALLGTRDVAIDDWNGGFEVALSRALGATGAVDVRFWMLDRFEDSASVRSLTNNLNTPINLSGVTIGGANADTFFDSAREHRLQRTNEFYNLEVNFLHLPVAPGASACSVNWLAGARWFRFDESLLFGSVSGGNEFGSAGGINEAYLDIDVTNDLVGFQLGADGNVQVAQAWALVGGVRAGIFGNHIQHRTQLYRGDGLEGFRIETTENDVSMLGEINLALEWAPLNWFSAYLGYRAVFISGVALADEQIPPFLADTKGIADIDSNGDLIVHGARVGGLVTW